MLTLTAATDKGPVSVSGAVLAPGEPRILKLGGLLIDVRPQGYQADPFAPPALHEGQCFERLDRAELRVTPIFANQIAFGKAILRPEGL